VRFAPLFGSIFATCTLLACANGGAVETSSSAGGGGGAPATDGAGGDGAMSSTGHGCFSTETTCDGACVDTKTNPAHCGDCETVCADGPHETGACTDGSCSSDCDAGFVLDGGACKSFVGAYEEYPLDCPGCSTANPSSAACACPAGTNDVPFAVESDCPGVPMRAKTALRMCITTGVAADSDFGGAYQVDDVDGWCGATLQCRVGNPMAGGACACPAGFPDVVALRSIIRLPCDDTEAGTRVFVCGNKAAPYSGFAGAYQVDDFAPSCRVANPWTGDCTCPAGSTDRVYRVMVDGAQGLYGSTMHLCGT
jgi:hypothetical protein